MPHEERITAHHSTWRIILNDKTWQYSAALGAISNRHVMMDIQSSWLQIYLLSISLCHYFSLKIVNSIFPGICQSQAADFIISSQGSLQSPLACLHCHDLPLPEPGGPHEQGNWPNEWHTAAGPRPGSLVNNQKAFRIHYSGNNPQKGAHSVLTHRHIHYYSKWLELEHLEKESQADADQGALYKRPA